MKSHQIIFAIAASLGILLFILDLVRRRRLKEEYSWLWLLIGIVIFTLVVWQGLLLFVTRLIGAQDSMTTLYIFGFIFLLLLNINYSIRISGQNEQIKKLAQSVGILSKENEDLKNEKK